MPSSLIEKEPVHAEQGMQVDEVDKGHDEPPPPIPEMDCEFGLWLKPRRRHTVSQSRGGGRGGTRNPNPSGHRGDDELDPDAWPLAWSSKQHVAEDPPQLSPCGTFARRGWLPPSPPRSLNLEKANPEASETVEDFPVGPNTGDNAFIGPEELPPTIPPISYLVKPRLEPLPPTPIFDIHSDSPTNCLFSQTPDFSLGDDLGSGSKFEIGNSSKDTDIPMEPMLISFMNLNPRSQNPSLDDRNLLVVEKVADTLAVSSPGD